MNFSVVKSNLLKSISFSSLIICCLTVLLSCSNPMAKQKEISQLTKSVWNDDKSGQERTDKAKKLIEMMDAYIKANPKLTTRKKRRRVGFRSFDRSLFYNSKK
jgi:hypothetical protein